MEKPIDLLFVYGTLRRGFDHPLSAFMNEHTTHEGYATAQGNLYLVGYYPGLVISEHTYRRVLGELLRMNDPETVLQRIDDYEECSQQYPAPHEYRREIITVNDAANQPVQAWCYLYNHPTDGLPELRSGDFIREISSSALR